MTANPSDPASETSEIRDGIEYFKVQRGGEDDWETQCARCGSSCDYVPCSNCGGEGFSHHDCGEDTCCCVNPENDVVCDWCDGMGGSTHCLSSPEHCASHPIPGREHIPSTAMRSEAWRDV